MTSHDDGVPALDSLTVCPRCGGALEHGELYGPRPLYWHVGGRRSPLATGLRITAGMVLGWKAASARCPACTTVILTPGRHA